MYVCMHACCIKPLALCTLIRCWSNTVCLLFFFLLLSLSAATTSSTQICAAAFLAQGSSRAHFEGCLFVRRNKLLTFFDSLGTRVFGTLTPCTVVL
jgi:hypothetical protein